MAEQPKAESNEPRFLIRGQYIKDLSFENPHAPQSLMVEGEQPRIDVSVSLRTQRIAEQHYELTLVLAVNAAGGKNPLFLIELAYCAIVQVINIPPERLEPVLLIDCAFVLFPFARRVVADVTRDGGFPPLLLEPIDFHALYVQNKQKA
jgi:preprotein translocase subunit SecB